MSAARLLGRSVGGLLFLLGILAGLLLWVFYMLTLVNWIGAAGFIVAVIAAPGVIVFPIIFWAVEGTLPVVYFAYLLAGVLLPAVGASMIRD
jgi:hypothetical protein